MIKYLQRNQIDIVKYDACIENSLQSRIYAFSWYLDIVSDHWDVLILDDYKAVMPIPWRKKYGIKYVYPPFWVIELGIFSLDENLNITPFLDLLFLKFSYVELRMNTQNNIQDFVANKTERQIQFLPLKREYTSIFEGYRKDRKKDIQKAIKLDVIEKWNDNLENLIALFKNNVGKRIAKITEKDYEILKKLIEKCIENSVGEVLSIYNKENKIIASGFFLKHKNSIVKLVTSTDFKNRKNGANTYLIDRVIFRYHKNYEIFDFGGSSLKNVAKFSKSFGASEENYDLLKHNNLPILLRFFKR